MKKLLTAEIRNPFLLCTIVLGLMVGLVVVPMQFRSKAGNTGKKLVEKTESHEPGLVNFDIRAEKSDEARETLLKFREAIGKDSAMVADIREGFVRGENELRLRVPTLKIEYNEDIRIPEVITPDVWKANIERLTGPSDMKRSEILRNFVKQNSNLVGVTDAQTDSLKVLADYTNPDGNISYAHLEQRPNGIPVFRSEIKAGFNRDGQMIRAINNLAPGLDYNSLSTDFRNPLDAVNAAFRNINADSTKRDIQRNDAASTDLKVVFGQGDWATVAEKMYFPTEPGVAVASWRVLIWQPVNAYYVIVEAETGTMLWRKNITEDQTETATYNVYRNANAMIDSADSPNPLTPGPIDPTLGTQGARISRTGMTRIGNEAPYTFNNNGWITDGQNLTDGNAVEAGLDRDTSNGVDEASKPVGSPNRTFDFPFNPGNPVNNTGDVPSPNSPTPCVAVPPAYTDAQKAAAVQMFWVMNLYHDEMYRLGFTETSFNFQNDNFGRGGAGADRVSAEGQDCSGTNNANFSTPADGGRGRMQMYLWTGPTPDFDGTIDTDIIIHEATHGTSNRLHGNASGLSTNMSRGMGEGWSDFYGHAMLSEPTDPINGIYTTGGYATYLLSGFTANYYYGIRRFPKAVIAFTGGPSRPGCNNAPCPYNPLTFKHLNVGCDTTLGTPTTPVSSAFPRSPVIATAGSCDQVHNAGEIWSSALWEVRALMVTRLGWAAGNRRVLQVVTDGMKLAPIGPTFLQERDAIIAAASALPFAELTTGDADDVREGFRVRGMGFSASIQSISPASVTEAFDTGSNQPPISSFTYSCTGLTCTFNGSGSNDSDGSIVSYSWDFGDGTTGTGVNPTKTYASSGTRTVTLTVIDNGGASGNSSQSVTVTAPTGLMLSVTTRIVRRNTFADLTWTGSSVSTDIFRNGTRIKRRASGSTYSDNLGSGSGTATYQVCVAGTANCSNQVTITY